MDAPRALLVATLARRPDLDLEKLSRAIGRNHAYLRQYVMRGVPRELPETERAAVANRLGLRPDDLRSVDRPADGRREGPRDGLSPLEGVPHPGERNDDLPVYSAR